MRIPDEERRSEPLQGSVFDWIYFLSLGVDLLGEGCKDPPRLFLPVIDRPLSLGSHVDHQSSYPLSWAACSVAQSSGSGSSTSGSGSSTTGSGSITTGSGSITTGSGTTIGSGTTDTYHG